MGGEGSPVPPPFSPIQGEGQLSSPSEPLPLGEASAEGIPGAWVCTASPARTLPRRERALAQPDVSKYRNPPGTIDPCPHGVKRHSLWVLPTRFLGVNGGMGIRTNLTTVRP
jgi:hypothetical protein